MTATFDDYKKFISSAPEWERAYELLIFSHSKMSKTFRFVIDNNPNTVLTALNGLEFTPVSALASRAINSNDLDQTASFTIADPNNELDNELELIPLDTDEDILCRAVVVLSTDLDTPQEDVSFFVDSVPQEIGAFTVKSKVSDLNWQETGERFTLTNFPCLVS